MKTPKRDYYYYEHGINPENGDIIMEPLSTPLYDSRWKRKNRIAQLKRSLEKYKYGTHLSGSVAAAYRQLQCVVRPGKHAALAEWANYLKKLRRIQDHITCAIANTAIVLAYDAERKEKARKEKK